MAAWVLSFEFVANTPLNALGEEVEQLSRIPSCIRIMQKLRDELELYREDAKIEMSKPVFTRKDLWTFWTFNALILTNYSTALSASQNGVFVRMFYLRVFICRWEMSDLFSYESLRFFVCSQYTAMVVEVNRCYVNHHVYI